MFFFKLSEAVNGHDLGDLGPGLQVQTGLGVDPCVIIIVFRRFKALAVKMFGKLFNRRSNNLDILKTIHYEFQSDILI